MKKNNSLDAATAARLIEGESFPFEAISRLADKESWRKEVYRPIYHVHKWWAKRLGSVFRGAILGCLLDEGEDLMEAFYAPRNDTTKTVFDPFMGSGTTVGEAHKLGCIALGCDINPVAAEAVRVALGRLDGEILKGDFRRLSTSVGEKIKDLYREPDGSEVLYFFWVKQLTCPECEADTDLFSSRIIARNAYPAKKPEVQILCPACGDVFQGLVTMDLAVCPCCSHAFNPKIGSVDRSTAECPKGHRFSIVARVREQTKPPYHRLYAKLVLTSDGQKSYLPARDADIVRYSDCAERLSAEVEAGTIRLPAGSLTDGYNTKQAMSYNYRDWSQFFNARQLLALGWLHEEICKIPLAESRDALLTLFSGVLEFNNVFASYKGEGTGAVRHMFAHHTLKPERTPIEANVWGTPKSSGSFSNLFKSRLLRACDYQQAPFEVCELKGKRPSAKAFKPQIKASFPTNGQFIQNAVYLTCGPSQSTGLPNRSIDFVVTDPPFFDNVHYSELADFFYSWQRLESRGFLAAKDSTRSESEVQDTNASKFANKLGEVFAECHRVLKPGGLLVFSYHHSRSEGWSSVASAIWSAGFSVVASQPVKGEMSVAIPKAQAKEPIQFDVLIVCRRAEDDSRPSVTAAEAATRAIEVAERKCQRLLEAGFRLSLSDRRVVIFSEFLASLGGAQDAASVSKLIEEAASLIEEAIARRPLKV